MGKPLFQLYLPPFAVLLGRALLVTVAPSVLRRADDSLASGPGGVAGTRIGQSPARSSDRMARAELSSIGRSHVKDQPKHESSLS